MVYKDINKLLTGGYNEKMLTQSNKFNNLIHNRKLSEISWVNALTFFLFIVTIIFLFRYQLYLLNYQPWGDESDTIIVAKMMANGSKLYTEIFSQHGPLTFLPGFILELIGDFGVSAHRLPIVFLQWCALLSLYFSPIIRSKANKRFNFIAVSTFIVVFLPQIFGHTYIYQTIAGLFCMIIFSQYTLPSVMGIKQKNLIVVLCSILIVSLPFLAITYLPASFLFLLTSIRKDNLKGSILGITFGLLFNLLFIIFFGSINGYIAYHIYFNFKIFNPDQTIFQLIKNVLGFSINNWLGFLTMLYLLIITSLLHKNSAEHRFWRGIFVGIIIMSFWARGSGWGFHGLPYWYSLLGISPVLFTFETKNVGKNSLSFIEVFKELPLLTFSLLCIIKLTLIIPGDFYSITSKPIPTETEFSKIVKVITNKDDKILALTFRSFEYIVSDRLPASAHYFYLPWQSYYNKNPKLGIYTSLKDDILKNKPKIILADKWNVMDREEYAWINYASDIEEALKSNYYQINNNPYYVRKDINLKDFGLDTNTALAYYSSNEAPKVPLGEIIKGNKYIQLVPPIPVDTITGISIEFATYARKNYGSIKVLIATVDGKNVHHEDIDISSLKDNCFFDIFFKEPWENIKDNKIKITVETPDGEYGNAVTIWLGDNKQKGPEYDAAINNSFIKGKSFCYRILLKGASDIR